jgi:AraC-like DNA-binding protein
VESHYKERHQVSFYADKLHKSPKTLANLFALYNNKSPLAVIQDRLIMEAKRLLIYTDKSAKEIAYDLGFEDTAYFSNFFKKHTARPPMDFRRSESVLSRQ